MRALVAVTCIALLAAVGYFFWNEFGMAERITPLKPEVAEAKRKIAADISKFAPGQFGTDEAEMMRYCEYRWATMPSYEHDATGIRHDCRSAGYIK